MAIRQNLKPAPKKDLQRVDEATVEIVIGINYLLMKAQREKLVAITTILKDARESIAWWAAHDDYNESGIERIYHHLTCDTGLHAAPTKGSLPREKLLQTIEQCQLKKPSSKSKP